MIGLAAKTYAEQTEGCTLVSSVLPTPVGPQNMRAAMGRLGSFSPTRARFKADETADTASSCPITRACTPASRLHISLKDSVTPLDRKPGNMLDPGFVP